MYLLTVSVSSHSLVHPSTKQPSSAPTCLFLLPKPSTAMGRWQAFYSSEIRGIVPLLPQARMEQSVPLRDALQRPLGVAIASAYFTCCQQRAETSKAMVASWVRSPSLHTPTLGISNDVHSAYKLNQYLQSSHKERHDPDNLEASSLSYVLKDGIIPHLHHFKKKQGSTPPSIL